MNRRNFFKALSGGVIAGAVAPFLPISAPPTQQSYAPEIEALEKGAAAARKAIQEYHKSAFMTVSNPDGSVDWYYSGDVTVEVVEAAHQMARERYAQSMMKLHIAN